MKKFLIFIIALIMLVTFQVYGDSSFFKFTDEKTTENLDILFTCNIGIMGLQYVGNINTINPIDCDNAVQSIKNTLNEIPAINLTKKVAILKAIDFYNSKTNSSNDAAKSDASLTLIQQQLFYTRSQRRIDNKIVQAIFNKLNNDSNLSNIAKLWFENFTNPFYSLCITDKISRKLVDNKTICENNKTEKGKLDFLIFGEVEMIENLYVFNFKIYSRLIDAEIGSFQVVSDSENLSKKIREEFKATIPDIFHIKYASLEVSSDEDTRVFLNNKYLGKGNTHTDFIVPGNYILTFTKDNYEDKVLNITMLDFEQKKIEANVEQEKKLQTVNFYIEPLGSKIFINSVYRGVTPLKIALPAGDYMISVKNEIFESIRYSMNISEIKDEEINVVFHLKSKNINNQFKLKKTLYYVSFWNFTFSLVGAIPTLIFAYEYYYRYGAMETAYNTHYNNAPPVPFKQATEYDGKTLYNTYIGLYAGAAVILSYAAISLGWMFFSLFDYLRIMEKKDFIPILNFYQNEEGKNILTIGGSIKINQEKGKQN